MENITEMLKGVLEGCVLEKNNLVDIEKKPSTIGPPRKFYALNAAGREQLKLFWEKWDFISSKINELKTIKPKGEDIK